MSSRLSRKDIKRDEVMETLGGFMGLVSRHGRTILMAIAAVIVVALATAAYRSFAAGRAEEGSRALAKALAAYGAPIDPENPSPDDTADPSFADEASRLARAKELFAGVADDFSGTESGAIAGAYMGSIASAEGDLEAAREFWKEYTDDYGDNLLGAEIRLNLMAIDRTLGRGEELVDELRAELSAGRTELPEEVLLNQLGLTLESLGRGEEAVDIYERLVQDFPISPYSRVAGERISALEAKVGTD